MSPRTKRRSKLYPTVQFTLPFIIGLLLAGNVTATTIEQFAQVSYEGPGGDPSGFDEDSISGSSSSDINRDLLAVLNIGSASLSASIGQFGNYSVSGKVTNSTDSLLTHIEISSDENVNLTGSARHAVANFIIDGGFINTFYAPTLDFGYVLNLDFAIRDLNLNVLDLISFRTSGFLEADATGLHPAFGGADIGATFDATGYGDFGGAIDIPFSFQSIDLGIVPAGGIIDIEYDFQFQHRNPSVLEGLFFGFSDPASITGEGFFPSIAFTPANGSPGVPEPATALLMLPLLASLFAGRGRAVLFQDRNGSVGA